LNTVRTLCANIERDLLIVKGQEESAVWPDRVFEDTRGTKLVPIGKSTTKDVGAAMGFQLRSFMVWMIKGRDYWLWVDHWRLVEWKSVGQGDMKISFFFLC
jgi:hypothetical protein